MSEEDAFTQLLAETAAKAVGRDPVISLHTLTDTPATITHASKEPSMSTEDLLEERGKTHGDYGDHAAVTQAIKGIMRDFVRSADFTPAYEALSPIQQESLDMFAHKIGRILAGNPNEPDHWADIAGYATLVAKRITK